MAIDKLERCLASIREKTDFIPRIALVLGSGLGAFADSMEQTAIIPYSDIDSFPVSTAPGHKGRFVFGYIRGVPVVVMQGRVHYYEGYSMEDVVLPTRLMGLLGAKAVFLTNAAGGINYSFQSRDFMLISDHISSFVPSPLIGSNADKLGVRFPDMSQVYDPGLRDIVRQAAVKSGIHLREGIYLQCTGPQFETPVEIRMYRSLGADAVGMSTVCEAIAARHMGLRVCAVSCISNLGCGMTGQPLTAEEVNETADQVAHLFQELVSGSIEEMDKVL